MRWTRRSRPNSGRRAPCLLSRRDRLRVPAAGLRVRALLRQFRGRRIVAITTYAVPAKPMIHTRIQNLSPTAFAGAWLMRVGGISQ